MLTRSKCVASTGSDEGLSKIEPTSASKTKRKTSRTPLKQDIHRDRSPMRGVTKGTRHDKSEGSKKSEYSAVRKPKDIQDIPKITKVSHAIEGRSDNKVFVQWTSKKNIDHYIVFWNVQDELCQQKCTDTKSILLEDISGMKPTDICVAASRQGQLSDQSPPVRVPTVTIPHMQFDDKRTGPDMRVSMDGQKITIPEMVTGFQALVHVIRGNTPMKTGRFYWEVEAVCLDDNCKFAFGGSLSTSTWDAYPGINDESWGILLNCNYNETTIEIQHDCHCQHREVYRSSSRPHNHRYGQLLDINTGSVTIIDVTNGTNLYTFESVDTINDVIPIFTIHWNNTIQTT